MTKPTNKRAAQQQPDLVVQVNAPPPGSWEHSVDERDLTVEQWKELIYKEVVDYELTHNTHTDGSPRIPCLQVGSSLLPAPCSLLPAPCSLLPTPCSLLPAPCSLLPTP